MKKKVTLIGLLIWMLSMFLVGAYAEEETQTEEEFFLETFHLNVVEYKAFCADPYNTSIFSEENLHLMNYTKPTPMWGYRYFREDFARAHANNETIDACVKSVHPDIEIYESHIIKVSEQYSGKYGLGELVWLSTNKGLKVLEYKDIQEGNVYENYAYEKLTMEPEGKVMYGYDVIYYDSFDAYLARYQSSTAEVYVNGEKIENAYAHVVGGNKYILPLRFLLESCGVEVTYKEDFGGQVIFQGMGKTIYGFMNREELSSWPLETLKNEGLADLAFFQEPQYTSYLNQLKGIGEYEYRYIYPLSERIKENATFTEWNDRLMISAGGGNFFLALFGKKIEEHFIEDGTVYLKVVDVPAEDLYPVPQSFEEEV